MVHARGHQDPVEAAMSDDRRLNHGLGVGGGIRAPGDHRGVVETGLVTEPGQARRVAARQRQTGPRFGQRSGRRTAQRTGRTGDQYRLVLHAKPRRGLHQCLRYSHNAGISTRYIRKGRDAVNLMSTIVPVMRLSDSALREVVCGSLVE